MEITINKVYNFTNFYCNEIYTSHINIPYEKKKNCTSIKPFKQICICNSICFTRSMSALAMIGVALIRNTIFMINENEKRNKINKIDILVLVIVYAISIISAFSHMKAFSVYYQSFQV